MNRRLVALAGIWLMVSLVALVLVLLGAGRMPPLLAIPTAATAAVAIGGFRYYLMRGPR